MPRNEDIQSVARAMDILELAGNSPKGLALWEIEHATGLSKAAAMRIVRTMVHKGAMVKLRSPIKYALSASMRSLRDQQSEWNRKVLVLAIPEVISIARKTSDNVCVAQLTGGDVIGRFRAFAGDTLETRLLYGWRLQPYGTALAYQAYMNETSLAAYRKKHAFDEEDLSFWKSDAFLDRFLEIVRKKGYLAMLKGGTFRVASPVFAETGQVCALLALTRAVGRLGPGDASKRVKLIRQGARRLTEQLCQTSVGRPDRCRSFS